MFVTTHKQGEATLYLDHASDTAKHKHTNAKTHKNTNTQIHKTQPRNSRIPSVDGDECYNHMLCLYLVYCVYLATACFVSCGERAKQGKSRQ